MNTPQEFSSYDSSGTTSGAAMLLILQILPQLQLLKNCRGGWKAIADIAKDEIELLRLKVSREQDKFRQIEREYILRMASLRIKMQRAYDEKHNMKNSLEDSAKQLHRLQHQSQIIALNFSREKENLVKIFNESGKYILNNKEFLKNVSIELKEMILNNETKGHNGTTEYGNHFENVIKYNLAELAKVVQKMKSELFQKDNEITEAKESYDELVDENNSCLSSKEELQTEVENAKELEEEIKNIKKEKQELHYSNEHLLKKILSLLEGTASYHNSTLESIFKQTSTSSKGIQKYIIEPAEKASNLTLKSILKNRSKEQALISAVKKGNATEVALLLDYGANIEGQDNTEWNFKPLHWAAIQGHWELTRLCLLRGADINARAGFLNTTALHLAVDKNHRNIIDLLLKGGADIEARDEAGFTPLFRAVIRDCETAQLLIDRGANVSTANDDGITAVMTATDCVRELLCSKGATDPQCRREATTAWPCTT